jgi:hypothetical protein
MTTASVFGISVCGMDFAQRLVVVEGRGGKLIFALQPRIATLQTMFKEERVALQQVGVYVQCSTPPSCLLLAPV